MIKINKVIRQAVKLKHTSLQQIIQKQIISHPFYYLFIDFKPIQPTNLNYILANLLLSG